MRERRAIALGVEGIVVERIEAEPEVSHLGIRDARVRDLRVLREIAELGDERSINSLPGVRIYHIRILKRPLL